MNRLAPITGILALAALLSAAAWAGPRSEDAVDTAAALLELVVDVDPATARRCLQTLTDAVLEGDLDARQTRQLVERLAKILQPILDQPRHPLRRPAALLAACGGNAPAQAIVRALANDAEAPLAERVAALQVLARTSATQLLALAREALLSDAPDLQWQAECLAVLARTESPAVAEVVLEAYPNLPAETGPRAIVLLTQRTSWSRGLLAAIGRGAISRDALNVNQVRGLLARNDKQLTRLVQQHYGQIRAGRDPAREAVIREVDQLLRTTPGDPQRGMAVFEKLCGQCHKLHGRGQEVGPDITANGRNSYEQLLSNVLDPSLVIGPAYQARTLITADGRVLNGLLVEDNERRVVLRQQGGKQITVARRDIDVIQVSPLSLMPEGLEKQLSPAELADLFAYLTLDKRPDDPAARPIPGTPAAGSPR